MPERQRAPEQPGFSLIEILIVLGIAMIVMSMSGLLMVNLLNQYRLRTSTVDLSTLLQRARMQAVRDNRSYQMASDTVTLGGITYWRVFVDLNKDGLWNQGEPIVQMQKGVTVLLGTSGAGNPTVPNSSLGFTPQGSSAAVGFTGRGTPCYLNGAVCSAWGPLVGGAANPVGFIYYTRSTFSSATYLEAISIAPSGRFQAWTYDTHTNTWGH